MTPLHARVVGAGEPMLFLHGEKDVKGKEGAKFFFDKVLVAQPKSGSRLAKLPLTYNREIKTTALAEAELLGKNLGTEEKIIEFLTAVDKDRKNKVAIPKRGYTGASTRRRGWRIGGWWSQRSASRSLFIDAIDGSSQRLTRCRGSSTRS